MFIETTIFIKKDVLEKLTKLARLTGESRSSIISALLRKYADDRIKSSVQWSRVKYQDRDEKSSWQRFHLILNPDEYEFFIDLRKVFKKSVSACIADAIEVYLDEVSVNTKCADNYRYKNYSFARVIIDDVVCWILSWGVPRRPLTHLLLE